MTEVYEKSRRPYRFVETPPFYYSKLYAHEHACHISVPNGVGIGNLACFTRLVDEYARHEGEPLRILTAPFRPNVGTIDRESPYPFWENNPFVAEIVNADEIDPNIMRMVTMEQDNYCQFSHIITNMCAQYGLRPRSVRPSLFLNEREMVIFPRKTGHAYAA